MKALEYCWLGVSSPFWTVKGPSSKMNRTLSFQRFYAQAFAKVFESLLSSKVPCGFSQLSTSISYESPENGLKTGTLDEVLKDF
jgi:hypothetical protein